jgi:hypothetical protein
MIVISQLKSAKIILFESSDNEVNYYLSYDNQDEICLAKGVELLEYEVKIGGRDVVLIVVFRFGCVEQLHFSGISESKIISEKCYRVITANKYNPSQVKE